MMSIAEMIRTGREAKAAGIDGICKKYRRRRNASVYRWCSIKRLCKATLRYQQSLGEELSEVKCAEYGWNSMVVEAGGGRNGRAELRSAEGHQSTHHPDGLEWSWPGSCLIGPN